MERLERFAEKKKESAELNETILGPEHRNYLQLVLMRKMYDKMPSDEEILSWIPKYAETVSDIIDDPKNTEIRELALQDKYDEAAEKVLEILNEKEFGQAA